MKKIIPMTWLMILSYTAAGQETGQMQAGIKGGYDFFMMIGHAEDMHNHTTFRPGQTGFNAAVFFGFRSGKHFMPVMEVEYQWKSFGIDNHYAALGGGEDSESDFELGYLDICLKPSLSFGKKVKFIIAPGIYFGYLVNSHVTTTSSGWSMNGETYTDSYSGSARRMVNTTDLGIELGFRLQVPVADQLQFLAENSYSCGIINLSSSSETGDLFNFLNCNLNIGVLYTFK
jgi:hypothetical protein